MVPLAITLPGSSAYAVGDTADVSLDGTVIAEAIDLKPDGEDYPGEVITVDEVGFGLHAIAVTTRDALGNASAAEEASLFVCTGPRPASNLVFLSQDGDGPITFGFRASPDVRFG